MGYFAKRPRTSCRGWMGHNSRNSLRLYVTSVYIYMYAEGASGLGVKTRMLSSGHRMLLDTMVCWSKYSGAGDGLLAAPLPEARTSLMKLRCL